MIFPQAISSVLFTFFLLIGGDGAKDNVRATGELIMPPTSAALPEETAWQMIYAEGGALAVVLGIGVFALWKMSNRIFNQSQEQNNKVFEESRKQNERVFEETRKQNADLLTTQATSLNRLAENIQKVETAIKLSDVNNQHGLGKLNDGLSIAVSRLDKHEVKIEKHQETIDALQHRNKEHSGRLSTLELKIIKEPLIIKGTP